MGIAVNGVEIDDLAIEQELAHHQGADNPLKQAAQELVLRTVLDTVHRALRGDHGPAMRSGLLNPDR